MQAGFPGIQKARRKTDLWPAKCRAGALLALVPATSPPLTGVVVSTHAPTVVSWDSSRAAAVPVPGSNTYRWGNAGGLQWDLDLPCCFLAEGFCDEGGEDVLFRRQIAFFAFHLKDKFIKW